MKMYQLIEWFQIRFPKMYNDLLLCNHNFDEKDLNPYHLESDCWSHTMMVCKITELSGYDKVVQIAALLHDIGKPASRKINPRNNHIQFFGHEKLSADMAIDVLDAMKKEDMINDKEKSEVIKLIFHHDFLHKYPYKEALMEHFEGDKTFCIYLVQLSRCDSLGRFCADIPSEEKYQVLLDQLKGVK